MKSYIKVCLLCVGTLYLGACSTIISGTTQPFSVKTEQTAGAKCELVDSKGTRWVIPDTPGTVEITKGDGPLEVTCSKGGFKTASVTVEEGFAGATLGNILLGSGIGIIVDASTGAMQEYPDEVIVWLEPENWASAAQKEQWLADKEAYESALSGAPQEQGQDSGSESQYN